MADKNTVIQIISAILGSSLGVFAITTFYSEVINIPDIRAGESSNSTTISIGLTNNGRVPATNLILTAESYTNVDYELFTTENRTIITDDNRIFVAKFSRFVDGNGSLIRLNMSSTEQLADNPFNPNYIIYVTYDQGSLKLPGERQPFTIPIGMTVLSAIAAIIVFSTPYLYSRARRERKQLFVSMVSENILYYKENGDPFDDNLREKIIELSKSIKYIRDIFENKDDFTAISTFYTELSEHNIKARQEAWDDAMKSQKRNELKNKAKQTYEKIKWEEYDVDRISIFENVSKRDYAPINTIRNLIKYEKYNVINVILRPLLSIVVVPIVLSLGSYLISGAPLGWIEQFEVYHLSLIVIGTLVGFWIYDVGTLVGFLIYFIGIWIYFTITTGLTGSLAAAVSFSWVLGFAQYLNIGLRRVLISTAIVMILISIIVVITHVLLI